MCNSEGYKDRSKSFFNLDDMPAQDSFSISQIVSILYRFRNISCKSINETIEDVSRLLRKHIREYSKAKPKYSVYTPSISICDICTHAAMLLDYGDIDVNVETHRDDYEMETKNYRFQKKWLSNAGILIPQTQDVVRILPFLLTCYSANAPYNRLDPFECYEVGESNVNESEKGNYSVSAGWLEIFPEYYAAFDNILKPAETNLNRNIKQLVHYFTEFSSRDKPIYSSLLDPEGLRSSAFHDTATTKEFRERRASFLRTVKDWELYRRFAAFCDACSEYERHFEGFHFNLTLAMALFANCWEFDKNPENYLEDQKLIEPITWEDVEADCLHEEITEVTQFRGSEDCEIIDIHGIVRAKKSWFLCNLNLEQLNLLLPY